jgi:hypothetical protein
MKSFSFQLGHVAIFLQDYEDAESWPYLDKLICAWRKKEEETRAECGEDPAPPYGRCKLWRGQEPTEEWLQEEAGKIFQEDSIASPIPSPVAIPTHAPVPKPVAEPRGPKTEVPVQTSVQSPYVWKPIVMPTTPAPTAEPTKAPTSKQRIAVPPTKGQDLETDPSGMECSVPEQINCDDYDVNYGRMCVSNKPCCESKRSATNFCWESYDALGEDNVASACYHCCLKETGQAKCAAPSAPERADLPKTIQCSEYDDTRRMCKPDSCCSNPRSSSSFCQMKYATFSDNTMKQICHYCSGTPQEVGPSTRNLRAEQDEETIPDGAKVVDVHGRRFLLREENFEEEDKTNKNIWTFNDVLW